MAATLAVVPDVPVPRARRHRADAPPRSRLPRAFELVQRAGVRLPADLHHAAPGVPIDDRARRWPVALIGSIDGGCARAVAVSAMLPCRLLLLIIDRPTSRRRLDGAWVYFLHASPGMGARRDVLPEIGTRPRHTIRSPLPLVEFAPAHFPLLSMPVMTTLRCCYEHSYVVRTLCPATNMYPYCSAVVPYGVVSTALYPDSIYRCMCAAVTVLSPTFSCSGGVPFTSSCINSFIPLSISQCHVAILGRNAC